MRQDHLNPDLYFLTILLGLQSHTTLAAKANRQEWPRIEIPQPGKPLQLFPLETLPDLIQIAWSNWDKKAQKKGLKHEQEKGPAIAKLYKVLDPLPEEAVKTALLLPEREDYFQKGKKIWDHRSKGLCSEARAILHHRFPKIRKDLGTAENQERLQHYQKQDLDDGLVIRSLEEEAKTLLRIDSELAQQKLGQGELEILTLFSFQGDAMTNSFGTGRDILLQKLDGPAPDGSICLVELSGERFLRKIIRDPIANEITLSAENPDYPAIHVPSKMLGKLKIIGMAVGTIELKGL